MRLWNVETGTEVHVGKLTGHKAAVKALAFIQGGAFSPQQARTALPLVEHG